MSVDLMNRDPNNLNDHVKCAFEEVLAEPDGIRSMDCVWSNTYKCFECCKSLCYKIATFLCGICIGMCWGCSFAELAFCHIWHITPGLRCLEIMCHPLRRCYSIMIDCSLGPLCEACGLFFSKIKIQK